MSSKLKEFISGIDSRIVALSGEKKRSSLISELGQLSEKVSAQVENLKKNQKRKFITTRKALAATSNVLEGLKTGLEDRSFDRKTFLDHLENLRGGFLVTASNGYEEQIEADAAANESGEAAGDEETQEKARELISSSGDLKGALAAIKDLIHAPVKTQVGGESDIAKTLREAQEARKRLPIRLSESYVVVKAPIVPIFNVYELNKEETFKKLGIRFVPIDGYGMLLDQPLIGVSKKLCAKYKMEPLVVAEQAIELFNEKSPDTKYSLVTNDSATNPRNADIQFFWILPTSKVSHLIKISGHKAMNIKWGFPFS